MKRDHVAIVGGGFSGTLLAVNLLRHDGPRATLIEGRDHTARGVAYSTAHPDHLLNVRAENMSALPDDPDHFVRWLEEHRPGVGGFVPRLIYGDYLDALLSETMRTAPDRLEVIKGEVRDGTAGAGGIGLTLADGTRLAADHAVLALGNLPPVAPAGIDPATLPQASYVADPWQGDILSGLGRDDTLVVLGTGLTMVDVALLLDARGFDGRIIALSRHGLVPHAHARSGPAAERGEPPQATASGLVAGLRKRASQIDWRAAVDELRPHTQELWRVMGLAERQRFLRHLRPWWDIHRHRLAPSVAKRIQAMRLRGTLDIVAAKILGARADGEHIRLDYRPRHGEVVETRRVRRLVNGTGPESDLTATKNPLLLNLRTRGLLRADPLRIGIDVDQQSRAIGESGIASDQLTVIGPMTRGAFWEIVAVPDIRQQAWSVARRLSHVQW